MGGEQLPRSTHLHCDYLVPMNQCCLRIEDKPLVVRWLLWLTNCSACVCVCEEWMLSACVCAACVCHAQVTIPSIVVLAWIRKHTINPAFESIGIAVACLYQFLTVLLRRSHSPKGGRAALAITLDNESISHDQVLLIILASNRLVCLRQTLWYSCNGS